MLNTVKNFASTQATTSIAAGDLTRVVTTGQGARFPNPGSGSDTSFYVTVYDGVTYANADDDPNVEICLVTGRSTDTFTWTRAQQGTAATSHPSGSRIIQSFTLADLQAIVAGTGPYAVDTGATNAYVSTPTMYPSPLVAGYTSSFKAVNANTGASTVNVGGTGVKTLTRTNGGSLVANDIIAGMVCEITYDGTNWQLTNPNLGTASVLTIPNVVVVIKSLAAGTAVTGTVSSSVCTITHTSHGYVKNDFIIIAGATSGGGIGDVNQLHQITGVTTNTYTFVTTAGNGSLTGSPIETFWLPGNRTTLPSTGATWLIKNITRASAGAYVATFANTQADLYWGFIGTFSSLTGVNGVFVCSPSNKSTTSFWLSIESNGTLVDGPEFQLYLSGII